MLTTEVHEQLTTNSTTTTLLKDAVKKSLTEYFANLDGVPAANIYQLVLNEVERPMLETVMQYAKGNQSKAAKWLGLSRNTLRKLLEKHQINAIK